MSRPLLVLRPIAPVALLLALLAALAWPGAAPASASGSGTGDTEAVIAQRFAEARARAGLPAVPRSSDLDAVARDWARRQAADGEMKHNPQLREQVQPARSWYENVGYLRGVPSSRTYRQAGERLHEMWMGSDGHRANIHRTPLTDVGIGVAASGDEVYATVVFRDRGDAQAEPTPAAKRSPEPSPAPAPERSTRDEEPATEAAPRSSSSPAASSPPEQADQADRADQAPPAPAPEAEAASDEVAVSEANEPAAAPDPHERGGPPDLARELDRRGGVPHDDADVPGDDATSPPVELLVAPDDTVDLPVGEDGTRAVPLVFGLTTVAAAVVVGAGRSRRRGR